MSSWNLFFKLMIMIGKIKGTASGPDSRSLISLRASTHPFIHIPLSFSLECTESTVKALILNAVRKKERKMLNQMKLIND